MPDQWVSIAIQAGGAIAVCAMFLKFLQKKAVADDTKSAAFLEHLVAKDRLAQQATDKQMEYLRERDQQSKDIAINGHDALREVSSHVNNLENQIRTQSNVIQSIKVAPQ